MGVSHWTRKSLGLEPGRLPCGQCKVAAAEDVVGSLLSQIEEVDSWVSERETRIKTEFNLVLMRIGAATNVGNVEEDFFESGVVRGWADSVTSHLDQTKQNRPKGIVTQETLGSEQRR
jgi:hypothetical protein